MAAYVIGSNAATERIVPQLRSLKISPNNYSATPVPLPASLAGLQGAIAHSLAEQSKKMTLFILTETSAGYALLKAKDKKLLSRDDIGEQTETAEGVCSLLKLKKFEKFDSAATALEEISSLVDGKVTPMLAGLLDSIKDEKKVSLAVADPKLGTDTPC